MRVYYKYAPDIGDCPDGAEKMLSWETSVLSNEKRDAAIGWSGAVSQPQILLDMQRVCKMQAISVQVMTAGLPSPDWQSAEVAVSARTSDSPVYTMLGRLIPKAGITRIQIPLSGEQAYRFLRFDIRRKSFGESNYKIPLPLIQLEYGTEDQPEELPIDWETALCELADEPACCDRYGQAVFLDWPGKIWSDDMLRQQADEEQAYLDSVSRDSARYDRFGGWLGMGKQFSATGFFRTTKSDGVWWLVTPEGNPYIMKGVDLVTYLEGAYCSPLYSKGTDRVRTTFAELPDPVRCNDCYREMQGGIQTVNHLHANLMLKYGEDYASRWSTVIQQRLIDWGFNAASKWEKHELVRVPYVHYLMNVNDPIKIGWMIDSFDPLFEAKLEAMHGDTLRALKDDPYLIGYHFTNEDGWDDHIFRLMLEADETLPAKRAFVQWCFDKSGGDERAASQLIGAQVIGKEELCRTKLVFDDVPREIISEFIRYASDVFFRRSRAVIKGIDQNHLYIGGTLTPGWHSSFDWEVGGAAHLDVLSFDNYADDGGRWIEPYRYLDMPIVNVEYGFTATDRGHSQAFERTGCATQQERGERWQGYVEGMFRYPEFVGAGHFILYDQSITRGIYGEGYAYGLLTTQDQPYTEFLEYVKRTHDRLEELHAHTPEGLRRG